MIWGSQYDAMMNWMAKNGMTVGTRPSSGNKNGSEITGNEGNDVLNKVYDLYGCHFEWTLEATNEPTHGRVSRGGFAYGSVPPAYRNYGNGPDFDDEYNGSRLSLYIVD